MQSSVVMERDLPFDVVCRVAQWGDPEVLVRIATTSMVTYHMLKESVKELQRERVSLIKLALRASYPMQENPREMKRVLDCMSLSQLRLAAEGFE